MSVETNIYGFEPMKSNSYSGMEFVRPDLTVVPQVEQQEAVVSEEQRNALMTWVEENEEDATKIGQALSENSEYAGIFSIMASSEQLRTELTPVIMTVLRKRLIEGSEDDILALLSGNAQPAPTSSEVVPAGPSRWSKIREKMIDAYVKLDAGLGEDEELVRPVGQSWSVKTWAEVEQEVANDPRKSIRMANYPELRVVLTKPSRFEEFMNNNKVTNAIGQKIEEPLAKIEEGTQNLEAFLDDSHPGKEIALDSAAYAANKVIEGFVKLMEYDEKLVAATVSMLNAMDIPEKYTKVREFENELTEKIADKIIDTVSEYDYKATLDAISNTVHLESRKTKAVLAAGVAMAWVALTTGAVETDSSAVVNEQRIETVAPATVTDRSVVDKKDSATSIPELQIKPNSQ